MLARRCSEREYAPQQAELIASHVAALRRLDDQYGGGALSLRYVSAELRSVIDLVAAIEPVVERVRDLIGQAAIRGISGRRSEAEPR